MSHVHPIFEDKQLFQLIVNASPAGMVIVDAQAQIAYTNPQALEWLGYEAEELMGQHLELLVPEMHRDAHAQHHRRFMGKPKARRMAEEQDLFARRKDGTQFPVDISLHPFQIKRDNYVLANILDATQRRQAERLPQERLAAIGEMVAGLAHESRNALQRARGCLDLLELDVAELDVPSSQKEIQKTQLDLLRRIHKSLDDLEHNYDEVRNYAAPIVLDRTEVDLAELVREVFENLQTEFPHLGTQLELEVEENAALNWVDRYRIKQVIRNCMENAIQAGPAGSTVTVRLTRRITEGLSWQTIEMSDCGEGIAPDITDRIFQPFFTTKPSGTGLGLAICKRITDAHQGSISAHDNKAGGTTLRFTLPVTSGTAGMPSTAE